MVYYNMETIQLTSSHLHCLLTHLIICVSLWVMVLCAVLIDLWDRIYTQRKVHKKISSNRLRLTLDKVSEYWRFMLIAFIIDAIIFVACALLNYSAIPAFSMLFTAGLLLIEFKSLYEHAKERKSSIVDMNRLVQVIVEAVNDKDAKKAIKEIGNYLETTKK